MSESSRHGSALCLALALLLGQDVAFGQCHEEVLQGSHPETFQFGYRFDVLGDLMVVGAPSTDVLANADGAVYVFERQGGHWTETQMLTTGVAYDVQYFGVEIAIANSSMFMVQAERTDPAVLPSGDGTVYVFEKQAGTWVETQQLIDTSATFNRNFGYRIIIEESRTTIARAGGVHFFDLVGGAWTQSGVLLEPPNYGSPTPLVEARGG